MGGEIFMKFLTPLNLEEPLHQNELSQLLTILNSNNDIAYYLMIPAETIDFYHTLLSQQIGDLIFRFKYEDICTIIFEPNVERHIGVFQLQKPIPLDFFLKDIFDLDTHGELLFVATDEANFALSIQDIFTFRKVYGINHLRILERYLLSKNSVVFSPGWYDEEEEERDWSEIITKNSGFYKLFSAETFSIL